METPILAWLIQGIPECIALAAVVISMSTRQLPWRTIIIIGIIQAVITYIVRLLPFTPGVHVLVLITILGVLVIYIGKIDMKKALIFSAIGVSVIVLMEFIVANFLVMKGIYSVEELRVNNLPRIIMGYPHTILLFLAALMFYKKKINIDYLFNKNKS